MPRCAFCEHENPRGIDRCKNCGAWLTQGEATGPTPPPKAAPEVESQPADPFEAELLALFREGRKIEAIKRHRERTGSGLKEAKDAVEALAVRHGLEPGTPGCVAAAAFGLLGALVLILKGVLPHLLVAMLRMLR